MRLLVILLVLIVGSSAIVSAQKYPERKHIRQGNKIYENKNYENAETSYLRALELKPESFEAQFNLANSFYKQERYEDAEKSFGKLAEAAPNTTLAAQCFYNLGNSLFQQRKLEEAIEAYKSSLRINPTDNEAKFNLAYAQKLLEQDEQDGGGGDNNQDQQDNQQQQQNEDQQDNQDQQQKDGNEQPKADINRQEADQILDAVQAAEDNTKEKMDQRRVQEVGSSGKNW